MLEYLKTNLHKRALAAAFAVMLAVVLQHYYGLTGASWMLVSAFVVCQTRRGAPLKQAVNYFFVLMVIAIALPPFVMDTIKLRVVDTLIGGVIGVLLTQLFSRKQVYLEFSRDMAPIFTALLKDMRDFQNYWQQAADKNSLFALSASEQVLGSEGKLYPEWIFELGFNPSLRAGYRYFLLNIERLAELVFSMNYLTMRVRASENAEGLAADILDVMEKNAELLTILMDYFVNNKKLALAPEADYTSDMRILEESLGARVPVRLELLDIAPEFLLLTGLVRDLKDMRSILLQLIMALPEGVAN